MKPVLHPKLESRINRASAACALQPAPCTLKPVQSATDIRLILTTAGSREEAERIARSLVDDGLCERRLWATRTIPWQEITTVGPWPENRPNRRYVAIEFARSTPLSSQGTVIANPENHQAFLGRTAASRSQRPFPRGTQPVACSSAIKRP
jgi:hypothetical protein